MIFKQPVKRCLEQACRAALVLLLLVSTAACTSSKKLTYLQGVDELHSNPQQMLANYEFRIKPDDRIEVLISSTEPELLAPFGNNVAPGRLSGSSQSNNGTSGILVDKDGLIELPVLGKFQAAGLTRSELADEIKRQLQEDDYIKNPTVIVRFQNNRILVLGEVGSPGLKDISNERVTILDAIGLAGDLSATARRDNILVVREENGQRRSYRVDLTSSEQLLHSPVFYMQQNDVIYVESNGSLRVRSSSALTYLSATSAVIGTLSAILSLVFILTK